MFSDRLLSTHFSLNSNIATAVSTAQQQRSASGMDRDGGDCYQLPLDIEGNEYSCKVFENQRYLWLYGWGIDFYPHDPAPFTYATPSTPCYNQCVTLENLNAIICPSGWKWDPLSDWTIDLQYTNTNPSGWSYSTSFERMEMKFQNQMSSSIPTPRHVTRRRLWKRKMVRLDDRTSQLEDRYVLTAEELGSGSYAVVKLGYSKDQKKTKYAIKCVQFQHLQDLQQQSEIQQDLQNEIAILRSLDHPHIIKLYDVFYHLPAAIYLVLEYVSGGELFDRIIAKTTYTEEEARNATKILISTISYLHSHHIVHRDLKPENILMMHPDDDSAITITDFGFAINCHGRNQLSDFCGSANYIAPEILNGELYGPAVDLWSIGVIVYILLSGYIPFSGDTQEDQFAAIKSGLYYFPDEAWGNISDIGKSFVTKLLDLNPTNRMSAMDALNHPWVSQSLSSPLPPSWLSSLAVDD
jgi:calcium/calmodulin-dependent protein kinase I